MTFLIQTCFYVYVRVFGFYKNVKEKVNFSDSLNCSGYKLSKLSTLPFNNGQIISSFTIGLDHLDIWGPRPCAPKEVHVIICNLLMIRHVTCGFT